MQTNPLVESFRTDVFRSEARAEELSTQLGPNHPHYLRQAADYLNGRQNNEKLLWTLLNLEIWHRRYTPG